MNEIRVVFNATSLRPGGGLTVLLGVLQGIETQKLNLDAVVICSAKATAEAIRNQGIANEVIVVCEGKPMWRRQWWVTMSMGAVVNALKPDVFFSFNQFVGGIKSPQLVYHLNLLRFLPIDCSKGWGHWLAERIRNRGAKQALLKADANVFESHYLHQRATEVVESPRGMAEVVYIGLPDSLIDQSASTTDSTANLLIDTQNATLLSITNHNEHKDNPTLIRVLHSLVQNYPDADWRLKIAGSIFPEKWKLFKDLAKQLGVDDRIDWLGFISQDELTKHLQSSVCLVSTSRIESFCMVALEAMARGCPAVVANASSMPESVGDAAVLIKPGDHDGFADAIATFQSHPQVREDFVEYGYDRIKEFRWDRCGADFSKILAKLKR